MTGHDVSGFLFHSFQLKIETIEFLYSLLKRLKSLKYKGLSLKTITVFDIIKAGLYIDIRLK